MDCWGKGESGQRRGAEKSLKPGWRNGAQPAGVGMTEILRQWRNCYGLLTGFGASCRCPQERSANATQGGGENMWDGE